MEIGFYHPSKGYWQTTSEPSSEILEAYPEGTVEVTLKPDGSFEWLNGMWIAVPKTNEELAEEARTQRDFLLLDSDKFVLPDRWASMAAEQQTSWSQYRQALRDVPSQTGFPLEINWPTNPLYK